VKPVSLASLDAVLWLLTMIYVSLPVVAGTLSIASRTSSSANLERTSRSFFLLADSLGSPTSVFSAVFLYALVTYHRDKTTEFLTEGVRMLSDHRPRLSFDLLRTR